MRKEILKEPVFVEEIGIEKLAEIINEMEADDAVDLWEDIDEDEVGSLITTLCII